MSESFGSAVGPVRVEQRNAARVHCKLPVRILAHNAANQELDGFGYSEVITRDGGLICSPFPLAPGTRITVEHDGKRSTARVVGETKNSEGEATYGIHLQSASGAPFWGVELPPPGSEALGRKLLECSRCNARVVIDLSEVELIIFETGQVLGRACQHCATETLWREPALDLVFGSDAYDAPTVIKRERTANDRRYARIAMKKMKACIKRVGSADDVVIVLDMSRGGIRFQSFRNYDAGMMLEVAVPYTDGGANVFTSAQIVRVGSPPRETFPGDFAAAYVRS